MLGDLAIALGNRLGRNGRAVRILRPAYSAWLNAAYGRRGISWWVNGERLRIHPAVRHLIPQDNERSLFDYLALRFVLAMFATQPLLRQSGGESWNSKFCKALKRRFGPPADA